MDRRRRAHTKPVRARAALRRGAAAGVLLLAALVVAGIVAGCGGGAGSDAATTSTVAAASGQDDFIACMRRHGVEIQPGAGSEGSPPAPNPGGGEAQPDQEAIQACQKYRPAGGGQRGVGDPAALESFTSCLRDEGVELPDRQPGANPGTGMPSRIDPSDPTTAAALEKCQSLVRGASGSGGGQ